MQSSYRAWPQSRTLPCTLPHTLPRTLPRTTRAPGPNTKSSGGDQTEVCPIAIGNGCCRGPKVNTLFDLQPQWLPPMPLRACCGGPVSRGLGRQQRLCLCATMAVVCLEGVPMQSESSRVTVRVRDRNAVRATVPSRKLSPKCNPNPSLNSIIAS